MDRIGTGSPMSRRRWLALIVLLGCLYSGCAVARTSVFETVSDEDARLISAFLAIRVELHASRKATFVVLPNPVVEEAERVAAALAVRLQDHGFLAKTSDSDEPSVAVSVSVKPLTYGIWVRVFVDRKPFFFLFERRPDGLLGLLKESRLVGK
jgi:hypothetical protein